MALTLDFWLLFAAFSQTYNKKFNRRETMKKGGCKLVGVHKGVDEALKQVAQGCHPDLGRQHLNAYTACMKPLVQTPDFQNNFVIKNLR